MERVIMASGNKKKIAELGAILKGFGMEVVTKDDAGFGDIDPIEDGETYEENSMKKAREIMEASGAITLADDSGLEVEYLDGAPGVHSARFAGDDCDYDANNQKLLKLLDGVPMEKRKAKFITVITMLFPDGREIIARGECPGVIAEGLLGSGGFGYDPVFIPDGHTESFAELGTDVKNQISHRARAIQNLIEKLEKAGL